MYISSRPRKAPEKLHDKNSEGKRFDVKIIKLQFAVLKCERNLQMENKEILCHTH